MQKITLESRLIFHITLTTTNPSCPRNTSNLTAFPHCFPALQEDCFIPFPHSSFPHSPHLVTSLHVSWSKWESSNRKSLIFYHQIYKPSCISAHFLLLPPPWNRKCVFPPTQVQTLFWWILSLWPSRDLHSVIIPSLSHIIKSLFLPSCVHRPKNMFQCVFLKERKQTFTIGPRLYFISISLLHSREPLESVHFSAPVPSSIPYTLSSDPMNLQVVCQRYQRYHIAKSSGQFSTPPLSSIWYT